MNGFNDDDDLGLGGAPPPVHVPSPLPPLTKLNEKVEWALRSPEVTQHAEALQQKLLEMMEDVHEEDHVPAILRTIIILIRTILDKHTDVRASCSAHLPRTGNSNPDCGHANTKIVVRMGKKGNYRLVARVPIQKGTFLGLYFSRILWNKFEAKELEPAEKGALLTLQGYNSTIPLNEWLQGKRVVDGNTPSGRSCWMACGNSSMKKGDRDENAEFRADGRCYAKRNIKAYEEIRFYYKLDGEYEYQPPVVIEVNKAEILSKRKKHNEARVARRKRKKEQAGGVNKATAIAAVATPVSSVVPTPVLALAPEADEKSAE